MGDYYSVRQGDYLSGIAAAHGFPDYSRIWNHPNNAELKAKRKNPNVLFPGDSVFIPDLELREEALQTDHRHIFLLLQSRLQLRLVLDNIFDKPIADSDCVLVVDGVSNEVKTDWQGKAVQQIPLTAHDATLLISNFETPFQSTPIMLQIGSLDPCNELSGQKKRLNNLGYRAGDVTTCEDEAYHSAVEEFQCDFELLVDGICGPMTQATLLRIHGS